MINQLLQEIHNHKDRAKIVPISIMEELKQEMYELESRNELNDYQRFLIWDMFSFDIPKQDFEIRSVIIVATACQNGRISISYQGKKYSFLLPAGYSDYAAAHKRVFQYINDFLSKADHHTIFAGERPCKLLAVKSGLAKYGRNNLCYVEGMGSYINLIALFSDIESNQEEYEENRIMDLCPSCNRCLKQCPTGAIMDHRILIDNKKCLTFFNESGEEKPFPEWITPPMHNSLVGCTVCQEVCPKNREALGPVIELTEFSEEETDLLLNYREEEQLPDSLIHKLDNIELMAYRGALSRNLRVLLNK